MRLIEDITEIRRRVGNPGYEIVFSDGSVIWITKRRTIPALLILLKYGDGCERDLTAASDRLPEVKRILAGKYPPDVIQDSYGDANKPFSELWNEEGFTWITNRPGDTRFGSKRYILLSEDHERLFGNVRKALRRPPNRQTAIALVGAQQGRCNICGAFVKADTQIAAGTFCRDRVRAVYDHRTPVEKGGSSSPGNYQILCFFCNKSKWQICDVCTFENCDTNCVLAFPERSSVISPTGENIADRMYAPRFPTAPLEPVDRDL